MLITFKDGNKSFKSPNPLVLRAAIMPHVYYCVIRPCSGTGQRDTVGTMMEDQNATIVLLFIIINLNYL